MIIDLRFNEDYKSFRLNLDYIISDTDVHSKEQLSFLMGQRGFRKKKTGERLYPSDRQLTLAWDYIKSRSDIHELKGEVTTRKTILIKAYSYKRGKKTIYVKAYYRKVK